MLVRLWGAKGEDNIRPRGFGETGGEEEKRKPAKGKKSEAIKSMNTPSLHSRLFCAEPDFASEFPFPLFLSFRLPASVRGVLF